MKHVIKLSCRVSNFIEVEAENYWEAVLKAVNMLKEGKLELDMLRAEKTEQPYIDPSYKALK